MFRTGNYDFHSLGLIRDFVVPLSLSFIITDAITSTITDLNTQKFIKNLDIDVIEVTIPLIRLSHDESLR